MVQKIGRHSMALLYPNLYYQGGQSRGQHDGIHEFPEPLKSLITFVILSQMSYGKVQKALIFFCTRLCESFSWVCCSFQDYPKQLKKKTENSTRLGSHFSCLEVIWKTASKPKETFTQSCAEKYEGLLHFTA